MTKAYLNFAVKRLVQAALVILLAYVFTFVVVSILRETRSPMSSVIPERVHGGGNCRDHRRPRPGPADPGPALDLAVGLPGR